jgi:tetratricopeptide (TPR) repeat protein
VYRTFGQTYAMVNHFQPDLLVVRDAIAGRYRDAGNAERVRIGKDPYMDHHHFYRYLQEGRFPEYQLLRDFGTIAVYQRTQPPRSAQAGLRWLDLLIAYNEGKVYGIAEASRKLGDIHASVGLGEEAEASYRQAEKSAGTTVATYDRLRDHLRGGNLQGAREAWAEVSMAIAAKPPAYQATVRHHVASLFYESGFLDDAIREAQEVLRLNPELRACAFDLGLFYLASGDVEQANAAYARAVEKHGADAQAEQRLRGALGKAVPVESGEGILRRYFVSDGSP